MQRFFLLLCSLAGLINNALAQTPTYKYTAFTGTQSPGGSPGEIIRIQALYNKANFPGAPSGRVKAVYYRMSQQYTLVVPPGKACAHQQFIGKIGYTYDSVYKQASTDSFRTGLTTYYGPDTFSVPCSAPGGTWIRVPVKKGTFFYDPERYFAVEFAYGRDSFFSNGDFANSINNLSGKKHTLRNLTDRNAPMGDNLVNATMDLGFDLGTPDEIAAFSNISASGLFPNPALHGRFNITFEATSPVKEAVITVSDAVGRQLYHKSYSNVGCTFLREVDIAGAAPGIYFVKVEADGEPLNRRVIIE